MYMMNGMIILLKDVTVSVLTEVAMIKVKNFLVLWGTYCPVYLHKCAWTNQLQIRLRV